MWICQFHLFQAFVLTARASLFYTVLMPKPFLLNCLLLILFYVLKWECNPVGLLWYGIRLPLVAWNVQWPKSNKGVVQVYSTIITFSHLGKINAQNSWLAEVRHGVPIGQDLMSICAKTCPARRLLTCVRRAIDLTHIQNKQRLELRRNRFESKVG